MPMLLRNRSAVKVVCCSAAGLLFRWPAHSQNQQRLSSVGITSQPFTIADDRSARLTITIARLGCVCLSCGRGQRPHRVTGTAAGPTGRPAPVRTAAERIMANRHPAPLTCLPAQ